MSAEPSGLVLKKLVQPESLLEPRRACLVQGDGREGRGEA